MLAEDNSGDVVLVREALKLENISYELTLRQDGEQMSFYIDRIDAGTEPCPDVVLLDLNLPKRTGEMVLERLRQSAACSDVPVIVVTSSDSRKDREMAARLGATSYFRKPSDYDEFMCLGKIVRQYLR